MVQSDHIRIHSLCRGNGSGGSGLHPAAPGANAHHQRFLCAHIIAEHDDVHTNLGGVLGGTALVFSHFMYAGGGHLLVAEEIHQHILKSPQIPGRFKNLQSEVSGGSAGGVGFFYLLPGLFPTLWIVRVWEGIVDHLLGVIKIRHGGDELGKVSHAALLVAHTPLVHHGQAVRFFVVLSVVNGVGRWGQFNILHRHVKHFCHIICAVSTDHLLL